MNIAVLLTCHNRKEKTLQCLKSLFKANVPFNFSLEVFLVDDGSSDGTTSAIKCEFPTVNVLKGNGILFWAGGMRLAFEKASKSNSFDSYLCINDDVLLKNNFLDKLLMARTTSIKKHKKGGLYSGVTLDENDQSVTYGGSLLYKGINNPRHQLLKPMNVPQACHLTNANILLIEKEVIEEIGFFDECFTHGIADYDYSLRAFKAGFPVYLAPGICGYCDYDHGNNWSESLSLKKRIEYLKSPLGLAYKEYLIYCKRHFRLYLPIIYIKLWAKTIFPQLWNLKKRFVLG